MSAARSSDAALTEDRSVSPASGALSHLTPSVARRGDRTGPRHDRGGAARGGDWMDKDSELCPAAARFHGPRCAKR